MKKLFLILTACHFAVYSQEQSQINFQNRAEILGIDCECGSLEFGIGITFFDYDNDGWDDISFATADGDNIRIYRNNNGIFELQDFSISLTYQTKQINWVDFDNDGDNDLFVTSNTDGNRFFENLVDLTFRDISETSGMQLRNTGTYGASWGDINNDGYLDVFISNRDTTLEHPNFLYRNNGDGTFTDVSVSAGLLQTSNLSFCSAFFDFNNDGWQDIYVSNDKPQNLNTLYKNNGDGTFTDVSESSGTDIGIDAMTVTVGDYNNDGWFDIYISNTPGGNVFF